ncbi:hypothetical protein MOMA_06511 [Moraxella macacae 0408225]|uniref:HopJ type III effector protein n=1 Tax=Moraxella macacae 0408225 TaxID=1230338 RepID=L2F592_9GAMM|nr:HopJ type III effector protein [Moraxella macacae]ELA08192.1 hypothetical protein MOMA_06511 [Moraxella macacae 0408225]
MIDKLVLSALLAKLDNKSIDFQGVLQTIAQYYDYQPVAFANGLAHSKAGENEASAKILAFAQANHLNQTDTLKLFAEHYDAVKATPRGDDHPNIRNFMFYGWQGFLMAKSALTLKT